MLFIHPYIEYFCRDEIFLGTKTNPQQLVSLTFTSLFTFRA